MRGPKIIALALAALLSACVDPTPYQPATDRYGFSDTRIEENRYRISFAGNSFTSREAVETYLLYRAAEVTKASGHDWFRIVEQETDSETRYRSFTTGFDRFGFWPYSRRSLFRSDYLFGSFGSTEARPVTRYEAFANILMFNGEKPHDDPVAYSARDVLQRLGSTVTQSGASAG